MRFKFFKKLRKLWIYLPVIWDDEDWDYEYIFRLWDTKLGTMIEFFEDPRNCWIIEPQRKVKLHRLKVFRELIRRQIDNVGDGEPVVFTRDGIKLEAMKGDRFTASFTKKDKAWSRIQAEAYEQEWDFFCAYFKRYLRHWWD